MSLSEAAPSAALHARERLAPDRSWEVRDRHVGSVRRLSRVAVGPRHVRSRSAEEHISHILYDVFICGTRIR